MSDEADHSAEPGPYALLDNELQLAWLFAITVVVVAVVSVATGYGSATTVGLSALAGAIVVGVSLRFRHRMWTGFASLLGGLFIPPVAPVSLLFGGYLLFKASRAKGKQVGAKARAPREPRPARRSKKADKSAPRAAPRPVANARYTPPKPKRRPPPAPKGKDAPKAKGADADR